MDNTTAPLAVVKRQLDAYNARDLDAFMACWAPEARLYTHPDILLAEGHAAIRERHRERFTEPDLHATLLHRTHVGAFVVDREHVVRNFPDGRGTLDVIATYEVRSGLITRAWFISERNGPVS